MTSQETNQRVLYVISGVVTLFKAYRVQIKIVVYKHHSGDWENVTWMGAKEEARGCIARLLQSPMWNRQCSNPKWCTCTERL